MKDPEREYLGSYTTMVKSGEEYYVDDLQTDDKGFIVGVSERPRNICVPSATGCGLMTFF